MLAVFHYLKDYDKKKNKSHKIISFFVMFVEFELIQKDEYKMTCIKFKMR